MKLAVQETGFRVPMLTGLGATENRARSSCPVKKPADPAVPGHVGLPVSGNDAKNLFLFNGKLEVSRQGAETSRRWFTGGSRELTAAAFDDEGFYRFWRWTQARRPCRISSAGFDFDRPAFAEDF